MSAWRYRTYAFALLLMALCLSNSHALAATTRADPANLSTATAQEVAATDTSSALRFDEIVHWALLSGGVAGMLSGIGLSLYHLQLVDEIKRARGNGPIDAEHFAALEEPAPWYLASVISFVVGTSAAAVGLTLMGASE